MRYTPNYISYAPTPYKMSLGQDAKTNAMEALSNTYTSPVWIAIRTASMAASVYHGYRRNNSLGWALWWGLMGTIFPAITPAIAIAQGFGKPAKR